MRKISDAVEEFDGVWPFKGDKMYWSNARYKFSDREIGLGDYQVCTRDEFEEAFAKVVRMVHPERWYDYAKGEYLFPPPIHTTCEIKNVGGEYSPCLIVGSHNENVIGYLHQTGGYLEITSEYTLRPTDWDKDLDRAEWINQVEKLMKSEGVRNVSLIVQETAGLIFDKRKSGELS